MKNPAGQFSLNNHQTPSPRSGFRQVIIEPELLTALLNINPFLEDDPVTELVTRQRSFDWYPENAESQVHSASRDDALKRIGAIA